MRRDSKLSAVSLVVLILGLSLISCKATDASKATISETHDDNGYLEPYNGPNLEPTKFTMCIDFPRESIYEGNEIRDYIAKLTDVDLEEKWIPNGMTSAEYIESIIESGEYPDFIYGGDEMKSLYEEGALVPWDEYIEKYPSIKELFSDEEWEMFRQDDGHIYWANVFGNTYGESKETSHNDYSFWIQARVLEWDDYPVIETLDEYFDLLERYYATHPTMLDGTSIIPYTVLCEDWRYYCVDSAPIYLGGYADLGSVIVNEDDPSNPYVLDYNTSDVAEAYYRKLNEEYLAGIIDPDFADQTYSEYIEKLKTGCVLGMSDQFWNFSFEVTASFADSDLASLGCDYVPLGLTIEKGQLNNYHPHYPDTVNKYSGVAVTTSCENPDLAFSFINDLLSQKIHDLRFWGIEGIDYLVDENGSYYRTQEMRDNWADPDYQRCHCCQYSFLPQWLGTSRDGINAMQPQEQASEFFSTLSEPLVNCFKAYGAGGYADMLNSDKDYVYPYWAPLIDYSSTVSDGDIAWHAAVECKHEWIPKLIKSTNFDSSWKSYMAAYENCEPQVFIEEFQELLVERIGK